MQGADRQSQTGRAFVATESPSKVAGATDEGGGELAAVQLVVGRSVDEQGRQQREPLELAVADDRDLDRRADVRSAESLRCRSPMPASGWPSNATRRSPGRTPAETAGPLDITEVTSMARACPSRSAIRGGSGRLPPPRPR